MSNRFHSKFHRANHHTYNSYTNPDAGHDPIASPDQPFKGDFVVDGQITGFAPTSALAGAFYSDNTAISAYGGTIGIDAFGGSAFGIRIYSPNAALSAQGDVQAGSFISGNNGVNIYGGNLGLTVYSPNYAINSYGGVYGANIIGQQQGATIYSPTVAAVINSPSIALSSGGGGKNVLNNITGIFRTPNTSYSLKGATGIVLDVNGSSYLDGNVTITGNLSTLGSLTYLDSQVYASSSLEVVNVGGTTPAAAFYQYGSVAPTLACYDADVSTTVPTLIVLNDKVGINTATPTATLEVNGTITTRATSYNDTGIFGLPTSQLSSVASVSAALLSGVYMVFPSINDSGATDTCLLRQAGGSDKYLITFDMYDNANGPQGQGFAIRTIPTNAYRTTTFALSNIQTNFYIDPASGNVGVGTASPNELLSVNGKLSAKGEIFSTNGYGQSLYIGGDNAGYDFEIGTTTPGASAIAFWNRADANLIDIRARTIIAYANISAVGTISNSNFTATGANGSVQSVNIGSSGYSYNITAATVQFVGGGGIGAQGTVQFSNNRITGVTVTYGGSGYSSAPTLVFNLTFGTPAPAGPYLNNTTYTVNMVNPNLVYTSSYLGVKTSTPNVELTVNGSVSSNNNLYTKSITTNTGIVGIVDGSSASTGYVGEILTGTNVSLPATITNSSWINVGSITVTPGDWLVSGYVNIGNNASATVATVTRIIAALHTTNNNWDVSKPQNNGFYCNTSVGNTTDAFALPIPPFRVLATTNTTYYLNAYVSFTNTTGTPSIRCNNANIQAVRFR